MEDFFVESTKMRRHEVRSIGALYATNMNISSSCFKLSKKT